ncbi:hypothetical protein L198_02850 [Cryptococcus wingfieldii CBS 7118]|uniref:FAD dependent oxidoreductase domain-containing protein n=1 Tax=Cryptococcus wingfieldii CBS 7118 TaxID=1295528 RepID=A0A1E3JI16_9TREE|nr:hypothetical protein L198_02850 [Cryptococcus wingfieldii CBS 7118]ODO00531.1 hypothetical protein L198_02850 [Cryptococcus wingfieldii CBS 7118]
MTTAKAKFDVVVLGCGVLGLSVAKELVKKGLRTALVAKDLPEDVQSTGFASPWAGAYWISQTANKEEQECEQYTFEQLKSVAKEQPSIVQLMPFYHYWNNPDSWKEPWWKDLVSNYRHLPSSQVPPSYKYGVGYESFSIHAPLYLSYLASSLRSAPSSVPIIRQRLSSLDEAYNLPSIGPVSLVVNATGLGAKTLLGVEDDNVHAAKGQSVIVKAPGVKGSWGLKDKHELESQRAIVTSRPGPEDHVVLNGYYFANDASTDLLPARSIQMLKDAHRLHPPLDGKDGKGKWEDIEVVEQLVGIRPSREGGMRVEIEERKIGDGVKAELRAVRTKGEKEDEGREVGVLHAYGIGVGGYQASLGVAKKAGELAQVWFDKKA